MIEIATTSAERIIYAVLLAGLLTKPAIRRWGALMKAWRRTKPPKAWQPRRHPRRRR